MIIVRSYVKSSEKRFKSMEMKKLGHKKESDPQRRIEKFDKFAQKFNQNTCREFFFNYSDQKTLKSVVL